VAVDLCPHGLRCHHVGNNATLGGEEAALGLQQREVSHRKMIAGITSPEFGAGEDLVRQIVQLAGLPGALEDEAILGAGVYRAGDVQELLPRDALYLAPQLVGAAQEQHIGGVLEVSQPDDARVAMGGAHRVRDAKPLQTQHPFPSTSEVVGCGAAHRAHADDDGVVAAGVVDARHQSFSRRHASVFSTSLKV